MVLRGTPALHLNEPNLIIDGFNELQGASKKMTDSEIILLGAFRDCLLLSMKLGTLI